MDIVICGCVKNCGEHLHNVFKNINIIASHKKFNVIKIILSYDKSDDSTLDIINSYKETLPIEIIYNIKPLTKHRSLNIANARNKIMNYLKSS